jgi:PAS domain-containing protein
LAQSNVEIVLLNQLASCLAIPMLVLGPKGELLYFNESAEPILARRFDETGRMSIDEWMPLIPTSSEDGVPFKDEDRPLVSALQRRQPANVKLYLQGSDGRYRHITGMAAPLVDLAGGLVGALGLFWEVDRERSARPGAQVAVSRTGQQPVEMILMRRLAAKLSMPIFLVGVDGRLLYFNEAAEPILGKRFEDIAATSREAMYETFRPRNGDGSPLSPDEHPLWEARVNRQPVNRPIRTTGFDGVERLLEVTAIPLIGQCDRMLGAVGFFWEAEPA